MLGGACSVRSAQALSRSEEDSLIACKNTAVWRCLLFFILIRYNTPMGKSLYPIIFGVVLLVTASLLLYFMNEKELAPETEDMSMNHYFVPQEVRNQIEAKSDLIRVYTPELQDAIESPVTITGEARGYWFFEASFPIVITDWDGRIIGEGYAQAQDEWMTEDFVPFEAVVEFEKPEYKDNGALILRKDNPSGLPEHDDALEIPIYFQ